MAARVRRGGLEGIRKITEATSQAKIAAAKVRAETEKELAEILPALESPTPSAAAEARLRKIVDEIVTRRLAR